MCANAMLLIYIGAYTHKYIGHENCKLVGVGWTSIGALSEVWVGDRRDAGSGSDWGEHLRTTGPGPRTTLDLTHVRHSRLYNLVSWTI